MGPTYNSMPEYATVYLKRARALEEANDPERALPYYVLGWAYQLMAVWRQPRCKRGTYFDPDSVPDHTLLKLPEALEFLGLRFQRIRQLLRRTRIADVLWEYGGDASAAREAIDGYLELARRGFADTTDHGAMYAAGALARALDVSRSLRDGAREQRAIAAIEAALSQLSRSAESVAIFILVEVLIAWKLKDRYAAVERELLAHLGELRGQAVSTFHHQVTAIGLLRTIADQQGDAERARQLQIEVGETMVAEAKSKPAGSGADVVLLERAAQHFEKVVGDHARAEALRRDQGAAVQSMEFGVVSQEIENDLSPIREWVGHVLSQIPRERFWAAVPIGVRPPTPERIDELTADAAAEAPFLSLGAHTPVEEHGVVEIVDGDEGFRRQARERIYGYLGIHVYNLIEVARDESGVRSVDAVPLLEAVGRLDSTASSLATRMLEALDSGDWLTTLYLAAPLFERLLRRLADEAGVWTRFTNMKGGGARQQYKSVEVLLREIPMPENVREFAKHVLTYPGRNLRNDGAHGCLDEDRCTPDFAAQSFHLLLVLGSTPLSAL